MSRIEIAQSQFLVNAADKYLYERENVQPAVMWMHKHPYAMAALVMHTNALIEYFNVSNTVPASWKNCVALKQQLQGELLPTVPSLFAKDRRSLINFRNMMVQMNTLMEKGEVKRPPRNSLSFHAAPIDPEAHVVGGILTGYAALIMSERGDQQMVLQSLIEVSTRMPESPIFEAITNPRRLNWISTNQEISKDLQDKFKKRRFRKRPNYSDEPYEHVQQAWPPTYVYQQIIELAARRHAGIDTDKLTTVLRRQIHLWGGPRNLERWLRKYTPRNSAVTKIHGKNWQWLTDKK